MNGPLLTLPTGFDASAFPRSRSSSDLPDLGVNYSPTRPIGGARDGLLPRAASFTAFPVVSSPEYNNEKQLYRIASAQSTPTYADKTDPETLVAAVQVDPALTQEDPPKLERLGRRKSLVARPKSWIQQRLKASPERNAAREHPYNVANDIPPVPTISKANRDKSKTVTESFATFARKSWIAKSRSPSPSRNLGRSAERNVETGEATKMSAGPVTSVSSRGSTVQIPNLEVPSPSPSTHSPPKLSRAASTLQKIRNRPQSVFMSLTGFSTANSSASSLPRSSMDDRSTPRTSIEKVPPIPTLDKLQIMAAEAPRRRDELWSAFRSLENDFSKFQSKTWSLKTNVVRASLLPFLRNHVDHPSNKNLRPEDLDRRVMTLNKWWRGLLEVLDGRQNQTVSGVDRPVLLEAAVAIMTRPEWRMSPVDFNPLVEQSLNADLGRSSIRKPKSTSSLNSSTSQFLTESVYHHIRILFTQNLLSQIKFVVEKMSLRHAPASLVTFCGKAIAYAFFFVPDVADVLVRIWKLKALPIQRIADEFGLPRRLNDVNMDEVIMSFPAQIQTLGWTSVKTVAANLRKKSDSPPALANIPWYGPWVARWCGRDSDMFFVFVKHYHILAQEFMPPGLSLVEQARAPGFVLVHTQVLSVLDATIHRQPVATEPPPITFDDVLAGADATAAALPLPSNNSARLMAENRLIMLLRDFISERSSEYDLAQLTFAETFGKVMQAAARRTSIFHHNACFVMCDFMEEALVLYVRFHQTHGNESDSIDWRFWLDVLKKMLESQNTMSEIRLFAFLYGAWNAITSTDKRKEVLCLEWLISEEMFNRFFNHWCPMVRAYYMRLLCWRLCREVGEATDLDTKIYCTILIRLKANWAKYLFLKEAAGRARGLPPNVTPCHPAPGRRLVIMRNDNQVIAASQLVGFDGIKSVNNSPPVTSKRLSSLITLSKLDTKTPDAPPLADSPINQNKKRWSIMGKVLPSGYSPTDSNPSPAYGSSPTKTLEDARRETARARTRPPIEQRSSSTSEITPVAPYRALSFKFSLEWSQHFSQAENNSQPGHPSNRFTKLGWRLNPPRLPVLAQSWIGAKMPGITREVFAKDPAEDGPESLTRSTYVGRALAEWSQIVGEFNGFADRRKTEGVPTSKLVEIPTLSVEGFRKFG